jgi:hypothetical protein
VGKKHSHLLWALVLSFVLFNLPYGAYALYPFKLVSTWLHELGHGTMAAMLGGDFERMVVRADTSGTAYHRGASSVLARAMVSSAGYLGTSVFGSLLLLLGATSERRSRLALGLVAGIMLLSDLLFVRNLFGLVALGAIGAGLAVVALRASAGIVSALLNLIAAQSCLNALLDIRNLFAIGGGSHAGVRSDAATMAELLFLPYWFWAGLWMLLSLAILALTLWFVWRREGQAQVAGWPAGARGPRRP